MYTDSLDKSKILNRQLVNQPGVPWDLGELAFQKKINPGKVTVPDDPIIILRDLTEDLPPFLTIFFQRKLILREVPKRLPLSKSDCFLCKGR